MEKGLLSPRANDLRHKATAGVQGAAATRKSSLWVLKVPLSDNAAALGATWQAGSVFSMLPARMIEKSIEGTSDAYVGGQEDGKAIHSLETHALLSDRTGSQEIVEERIREIESF